MVPDFSYLPFHSVSSPSQDPHTTYPITVLISLSPSYPVLAPPQLQLLSRYLGPYGVDPALFGAVLRTYISRDGVEWIPGAVCVFDGLERTRETCEKWLGERMSAVKIGELVRDDERPKTEIAEGRLEPEAVFVQNLIPVPPRAEMPAGLEIIEAEQIVDRKSVFIGRACRITDPSQVFFH